MKDILKGCEIIDEVSNYCEVPFERVVGTCRKRELVRARHLSMCFIDMLIKDTLDNKGSIFGKGHDDIIFARHSVNTQIEVYRDYRYNFDRLRCRIEGRLDEDYKNYLYYDTDKV